MPEAPAHAAILALEERAFNAWPALQTLVADGWLLRFADGYTKRANSLNAWRPYVPIEAILPHARRLYGARNLPLIVRLSPLAGAGTDRSLADLGFARADETIVMTAPLHPTAAADDGAVTISAAPSAEWSDGFATANGIAPAVRDIHDRMLAAVAPPCGFAALTHEGRTIAWGLAVVERGHVGLFDIATHSDARRRGAGRRLVAAMLAWAGRQGASHAYLQVVATNVPAIALYRQLGFAEHYRYHYRIAPP